VEAPIRRHLIVAIVSLAALSSVLSAPSHARVRFGVEGGLMESGLTYHLDEFVIDHPLVYRPSWSVGVTMAAPLPARLSLETGVRYVEYGDRLNLQLEAPGLTATSSSHQVWRTLAVPALLEYHLAAPAGLFVGAGPQVSYLLAVWHKDAFTITETSPPGPSPAAAKSVAGGRAPAAPLASIFEGLPNPNDATSYYRRWDVAACGEIGYEFPLGGHSADVRLRYTRGLTDIAKSDLLNRQTRGLEALVGARW
jgi:hypothetical protein